ncbi:MAG: helix-turn-helix transcriptional regulator [Bacteroidia bacterium]|nr:helix-turn-helix transcriptional regulator [Bacteroidia bacterium]
MEQNLKLLTAIRERGMRQVDFAKAVGDHFTFVSRVINGWINLDEGRKAKYAMTLGKPVQELFEK